MRKRVKEYYNKYNIIIMFFCVIIFLMIAFLLVINKITPFDNWAYKYIVATMSPFMTKFFEIITFMGSFYVIAAICLLSFVIFKDKRNSFLIIANSVIIFLISIILKFIFLRDRPIDINIITAAGYSFPSGHSAVSVSFYGFLAYLSHKNIDNPKIRYFLAIFLSLLAFLIGISRIYLGVHYASDVLAGFAISLAYLILFVKFVYKKGNK